MASNITITGNLGQDATRKRIGETDMAELRVGVDTGWSDHRVTTWWTVEVWGRSAEWLGELRKGAAVTVCGEAWMREYETRDGGKGSAPTIRAAWVERHERSDRGGQQRGGRGGGAW